VTTEHKGYPPIEHVIVMPPHGIGPAIRPMSIVAALTPSLNWPRARIMLSTTGPTSLTIHQATKLRGQLAQAIGDVLRSCPELAAPDSEPRLEAPAVLWWYSANEEHWPGGPGYATRADAITAAEDELGLEDGQRYYTARAFPLTPEWVASQTAICLDVANTINEYVLGEVGFDDGIDVTKPMIDDIRGVMSAAIAGWLRYHDLTPKWSRLEDLESHVYDAPESVPFTATACHIGFRCEGCGGAIDSGEQILSYNDDIYAHAACPSKEAPRG
jgi:hypothetical protein